jgi:glutamyl/glutaminyl-tRNA synthetase
VEQLSYRGRLAPSPTGLLHLGHARTFFTAYQRAVAAGGTLVLRNEDLDPQRSRPEFVTEMVADIFWLGIRWQEGLMPGGEERGELGPYSQSRRTGLYLSAWQELLRGGYVYPCACSRRELAQQVSAPQDEQGEDAEPIYPGTCRRVLSESEIAAWLDRGPAGANWRFRVPDGEAIAFRDNNPIFGAQAFAAGRDFGDFALWRRDGVPAYQLACVVDDAAMQITEVVRGADLLVSTARQILLQRALALPTPEYFHCELVRDAEGKRLAKRSDALSLRALREQGMTPRKIMNI